MAIQKIELIVCEMFVFEWDSFASIYLYQGILKYFKISN